MGVPNKTDLVSTRATPARKALYLETAAAEGMRLSEWVRRQLDRRVAERSRQVAER